MENNNPLREELEIIFKQVAHIEGIQNCEIHPDLDVIKGDGFLGEFYTGHVKNKDTGETIQIYVKKTTNQDYANDLPVFENEIHFYSKIFPKLDAFQKEYELKYPVNCVPKYFCSELKPNAEYLVMENLKINRYELYDKTKLLDEHHLNHIFKNYGKFHALSYTFRIQVEKQYYEIVKDLKDVFEICGTTENSLIFLIIKSGIESAFKALGSGNKISTKIKILVENFDKAYNKAIKYNGKYNVITHGDCWSNNMMFKYVENGNIESMKLLDFQFCRHSTPVHDLSYFFYSGASKEDFNKLDSYLEIYHKSFSSFALELGCDPDKIFPLDVLKSEWKENSVLGILMGIMVWQIKLMDRKQIMKLSGDTNNPAGLNWDEHLQNMSEDDIFKKRATDILYHAVEYGIV